MIRIGELDQFLCGPETPIREALARINQSAHLFQIVVDEGGRLLGTVTDGDVRRAVLRGVDLTDPVRDSMNAEPLTGRRGADAENLKQLRAVGAFRAFLPVLDDAGVVCEVLVAVDTGASTFLALVMAGGRGSRLGKRTRNTPKPLLTVGEKPILEHVLARLEAAGVAQIYVAVHYLGEQIENFISSRASQSDIHIIREETPLGTAGAIARMPSTGEPLLVLNGDIVTDVDIPALAGFHHRHDFDATIAVAQHEVRIPFGVVRHGKDGMFLGVEEKPATTHFVAAGIYFLSPEMVALVPQDRPMDMPELLNKGRSIGLRIGVFPIHEFWIDVGRPHDLEAADNHPDLNGRDRS